MHLRQGLPIIASSMSPADAIAPQAPTAYQTCMLMNQHASQGFCPISLMPDLPHSFFTVCPP